MSPNFYGVNIDRPLSVELGLSSNEWQTSTLGGLHRQNSEVYLKEIPFHHRTAEFAWRVVDAYWSGEDGIITTFRAYGLNGEFLSNAAFGVTWDSCPHVISTGDFRYRPERNQQYVPVDNRFTTPNTGGYTARVLDRNWPSEGLAFGILKGGKVSHQAPVISWRLLALGPGYPQNGG